jgi:hypothetical protein
MSLFFIQMGHNAKDKIPIPQAEGGEGDFPLRGERKFRMLNPVMNNLHLLSRYLQDAQKVRGGGMGIGYIQGSEMREKRFHPRLNLRVLDSMQGDDDLFDAGKFAHHPSQAACRIQMNIQYIRALPDQ